MQIGRALDWELLERLRAHFLSEEKTGGPDYWTSQASLENYEMTFAQRIAWKWQAVLRELNQRSFSPSHEATLVDFGCGTGIAGRTVANAFGIKKVALWDRSPLARQFALEQLQALQLEGRVCESVDEINELTSPVILLSHLVNELPPKKISEVLAMLARAEAFIWVEPGTPECSRKLIDIRAQLGRSLTTVAPCLHQAPCGMQSATMGRHWCHHSATPPQEVFHSPLWNEFGRRLKIDLRSLPVSFLVMTKKTCATHPGGLRLVGPARIYKGYATGLFCDESGVTTRRIRERLQPQTFEQVRKREFFQTFTELQLDDKPPTQ